MNIVKTIIVMFIVSIGSVSFAEDIEFKDHKAKSAKKEFEKAVEKIENEREKALRKVIKEYTKDLSNALKYVIKKGDLEQAVIIKNTIEQLENEEFDLDSLITKSESNNEETEDVTVVLWNQNRSTSGTKRGSTLINILFIRNDKVVFRKNNIKLELSEEKSAPTVINTMKKKFDKVRVEINDWYVSGAGLAEIEILKGGKNYANGCVVTASATMSPTRYNESNVTDGIIDDPINGYWLLPDKTAGWIEVDLSKKYQ